MDWKPEVFKALSSDDDWDSWFTEGSTAILREDTKSSYVAIILATRHDDAAESEECHNPMLLSYLPFSYRTLDKIATELSLHGSMVRYINRGHAAELSRTYLNMGTPSRPAIVYNCRSSNEWPGDLAMSITYFIESGTTHAIVYGCNPEVKREITGRLGNAEGTTRHPLLLVGIFAEIERKRHFKMVTRRLEKLLGFVSMLGSYSPGQANLQQDVEDDESPIDPWLDASHMKNRLETWRSQLLKMTQHADELPARCWLHEEIDVRNRVEEVGQRIKERLEQIIIDYEEKIRELEMIMEGTNLATSLTHTKTNIDIALSTKRDGSQMKSIALLTMVFLPATFVASLFSMTFFQWIPEDSDQTVSPYLWIYFVVALGLTLLTVGLWYLFANNRKVRLDDNVDLEQGTGLKKSVSDLSTFKTKPFAKSSKKSM
ncbi:protein kinase [Colletotrichum plurivorum]|uniref:Protein kinase n=1 Tax=Colletotrichum plurivorum TaxID=2175906 RepID=A0A8H6NCH8_9PEZI|nr:protein kinase [Colletotrichum plurivorum]